MTYIWNGRKDCWIYPAVVGGERFLEDKKAMKSLEVRWKLMGVPAFYGASYIQLLLD